ncbi:MAG: UDP-N-acetylmuramate dehydrogenase [Bacillota bacterium]|nr:UDP-N-acetylmuramate dehydrogenase [Bacillota bacterium]
MSFQQLTNGLRSIIKGEVLLNEPLKNHTTWKIGGPADILVIPNSIEEVVATISKADEYKIPVTVIGNGSNILVLDGGVRGIVIKLNNNMSKVTICENVIEAEAGISLPKLSQIAAKASLSGLEFASGIPATLGGAIIMNAGALGGEISNRIVKVAWVNNSGEIFYTEKEQLKFSYRNTVFPVGDPIVLKAWLKLEPKEKGHIQELIDSYMTKRKMSQPFNKPNAGSVFKNPSGNYAGKLIEDAGLKGFKFKSVQISEIHANFIVNCGDATADDVLELIKLVKERVYKKTGVLLELEVKVLGEA